MIKVTTIKATQLAYILTSLRKSSRALKSWRITSGALNLNTTPEAISSLGTRTNTRDAYVRYAVEELKLRSAILDGEIVALDEDGVPRFQLLQEWQKRPKSGNTFLNLGAA
jgi:hypothetical protein